LAQAAIFGSCATELPLCVHATAELNTQFSRY